MFFRYFTRGDAVFVCLAFAIAGWAFLRLAGC